MALPRSTPEEQGVDSAVLVRLVDALVASEQELHSLMVLRHGKVIAEGWWSPYAADLRHEVFSVSKSFTSMAVGFAIADGKFGLDDKIVTYFEEHLPDEVSDNLAAMTVRDLLTMTTGHVEPVDLRGTEGSWLRAFFDRPVEKQPGTWFVYNTPATYVLSALVQRQTGSTVLDYLTPRLFDKLGITEATWPTSPEGITLGGFGLSLTTESLAKFGQLMLDNDNSIVPADWITAATSAQVPNDNQDNPDWKQGYGLQFWRSSRRGYRADGAFGQFCLVLPEDDLVIVTTSATANMQAVLDAIWSALPDMFGSDPLPVSPAADTLKERLAGLTILPPVGAKLPVELRGRSYEFDGDGLSHLTFGPDEITAGFRFRDETGQLVIGQGEWHDQTVGDERILAGGVWRDDRFVVTARLINGPYVYTFVCRLDDEIEIDGSLNVVLGTAQREFPQRGRLV